MRICRSTTVILIKIANIFSAGAVRGGTALIWKYQGRSAVSFWRTNRIVPVSYTHLDVYKRQSHNLREMEGICNSIGILDKGRMHIERDLDELKSDINKIQVAFNYKAYAEKGYAGLNIVHRESRGKVDLLIIRNDSEQIRRALEPYLSLIHI